MRLSIRSMALLTILVPMLLPPLVLSMWHTGQRMRDVRSGLSARGEHEVRYLADAGWLALLVGDGDALQRLAAGNLAGADVAVARLFLDVDGQVLAAAGDPREVELARRCFGAAGCQNEVPRQVFAHAVYTSSGVPEGGMELGSGPARVAEPIGTVLLSVDLQRLESIQRAMLRDSALVTLGALLLAWIVAGYFSRRLTGPMQRLSAVVARIQNGELDARTVPSGSGELRELERGINAMADRVEASSRELTRRVDEATFELSRALFEREQRNRELDAALERAESASRAKDLFLARMSHELRTPLATVTGYARLMLHARSEEQREDFHRTLEQASQILVATVDDVLTFVKLEEGSLPLELREFDLEACLEDAVRMQAPAAHAKGLDIVCHTGGELPCRVLGDSLRLSQILANLISNAIKFTPRGVVSMHASVVGERLLRVVVNDTGVGIPPESIPRLFHPFVQGDESITRRFGGSGLGLSITQSLVQALGGQIELRANLDGGTCVTVALPLTLPERSAPAALLLPRLRVALAYGCDSPHLEVLREYLGGCFELREFSAAQMLSVIAAGTDDWVADVCLALGDAVADACRGALPASVALVRLQRVEVAVEAADLHQGCTVTLPLRRRELLAACLRGSGSMDRVDGRRCGTAADNEADALGAYCLVVEDNAMNRRMIGAQLRALGVRVSEVGSGVEALELLARLSPDIVFVDVHMPGMDGVTLVRQVRKRFPELPVYALTANVIGSEERALGEAGVRAVLYKPLDITRLLEVLREHSTGEQGWQVAVRPGVVEAEVEQEVQRLFDVVCDAVDAGNRAVGADAAHQLLGVARLFTRGELAECCLGLELAMRDDDEDRIRQEVENLSIIMRANHDAVRSKSGRTV